jgi:hypothetical protein
LCFDFLYNFYFLKHFPLLSELKEIRSKLSFGLLVFKDYFIIIIQPLGRFGQEPEPSQVTGMALVRCILGKFLGVVCHCFPLFKDIKYQINSLSLTQYRSGVQIENWMGGTCST